MMEITACAPTSQGLNTLKQYPQWVNYQLTPRADGKTDKIPIDPTTGHKLNWLDPVNHRTYEQAAATGLPVGFVFTAGDPFFFLDIDNCWDDSAGGWNQTAHNVLSWFPGCAVEISQSGKGLHVFGVTPVHAEHCSRNSEYAMEFYTQGRFCATTESGVIGDAATGVDPGNYQQFISTFFPPSVASPTGPAPEWTTVPDPEWRGPDDDSELINRMLESKGGAKAIMGISATPAELWVAHPDALGRVYPDDGGQDREFDWSKADAALCSHLAFWTGKDCERMQRLWGMSALGQRDKYHNRPDYVQSTILGAVANCSNVYRDPNAVDMMNAESYMDVTLQLEHFKGCVYIMECNRIWSPDWGVLGAEQFRAIYGGHSFAFKFSGKGKTTLDAWKVFTQSQLVRYPMAHGICFRPELGSGEIIQEEDRTLLNTYVPINTVASAGNPGPFLDLIHKLLPDPGDREILLAYMAACVQYPGVKFQWAPVLQGTFGNGKSSIAKILSYCIGHRYTHKINPKDIDNKFNAWLTGKLLVVVDEVKSAGTDVVETLKWMITDDRVPIQAKGQDQTTGDSRANFILCTNYTDGVVKNRSDRRFSVFLTAQQSVDDMARDQMLGQYFPNFYAWLESGGYAMINGYLRAYAIPDHLNPAGVCVRAPETSTTEEAIIQSRSETAECIAEAIESRSPGFTGDIFSSHFINFVVHRELGFNLQPRRMPKIMSELGYVKVKGRASRIIPEEGGKQPFFYVHKDHWAAHADNPPLVTGEYIKQQGYSHSG